MYISTEKEKRLQPNKFKLGNYLWILIPLCLAPALSYAYLDPGTGSYLIQVLIGVLLAGPFAIKKFFGQFTQRGKAKKEAMEMKKGKASEQTNTD